MLVVKFEQFVNAKKQAINNFLANIPAENVVSVSFQVHGTETSSDEYVAIFYKDER